MPLQLRIIGARNARGKVTQFRERTFDKIQAILEKESQISLGKIKEAMYAWYNSGEGSGRVANSLSMNIRRSGDEVKVSLRVSNFRELKYMTTLVPDNEFRAGPYDIKAGFDTGGGRGRKLLRFFWKREGREFRGKVVHHPGFGQDVLRNIGNQELARMGYMVEYAVRTAVAEVGTMDSTQAISNRR